MKELMSRQMLEVILSYLNSLISSPELDALKETTPSKWTTVSVQWYIRLVKYQSLYEIPSSQSWITW